jgi:hypothetical protein
MTMTITIEGTKYALINYVEIIDYYKQPFYKKWFNNPPIKELIELEDNKTIEM